jgi:hypothetical protein
MALEASHERSGPPVGRPAHREPALHSAPVVR